MPKPKLISLTKEEFVEKIKDCKSISDIHRLIFPGSVKDNRATIRRFIKQNNVDISYFPPVYQRIKFGAGKFNPNDLDDKDIFKLNPKCVRGTIKYRYMWLNPENKCTICKIDSWQNKKIELQLDHINGNHKDNRLENLRLICPNCHSQTKTYCTGYTRIKAQWLPDEELLKISETKNNKEIGIICNAHPVTVAKYLRKLRIRYYGKNYCNL